MKLRVSGILTLLASTLVAEDFSQHDRNHYVQYMNPTTVSRIVNKLPRLEDKRIDELMRDTNTIWYDEESMVFAYQDSVETVVGLRANRVGRETGENSSVPDIRLLMNYFGEDKRFRFPFRTAAGTDSAIGDVEVYNFWVPARNDSDVLPVKWWKASRRGRWHWIHPVGTLFGEVLLIKDPQGEAHVFEVRIRERYLQGWDVNVFRPFQRSSQLVAAIKERRPKYRENPSLVAVIDHLESPQTLSPFTLRASQHLDAAFPALDGALDKLPSFGDNDLVREILKETTFQTVEGRVWRENDQFETYAPSSSVSFSIVPKDYTIGMIPVNETSCNRCHEQTGRGLRDFEDRIMLYGEVWGEDKIFTWHLFKVNPHMFGTFDDSDGSRFINPRLVAAGLVEEGRPNADSKLYRLINKWPLPQ